MTLLKAVFAAVAIAVAIGSAPAMAQAGADRQPADRASAAGARDARSLLHSWRVTLDYGLSAGPIEDAAARIGYTRSNEVKVGLDVGIGDRGFARVEAGGSWSDTKRRRPFHDFRNHSDETLVGATGGLFVLPYLAAGLSLQYRFGDGEDVLTNRTLGTSTVSSRDDDLRRVAPFLLLTAPLGPVRASLLGAYVDIATSTDYVNGVVPSDSGRVRAALVDAALAWPVAPYFEIEGSVGWTHVTSQRTPADALTLDSDVGAVGLRLRYDWTEGIELRLRGSHDFANSRGDGYRFGGGLAYRF